MTRYRHVRSATVPGVPLAEVERRFILHHESLDRSAYTIRNHRQLFVELRRWGKFTTTDDVTPDAIREFSVWLRDTPLRKSRHGSTRRSQGGLLVRMRQVRALVRWLQSEKLVDPEIKVRLPAEPQTVRKAMSEEQLEAIWQCSYVKGDTPPHIRNRALLAVLLSSGLRVAEVADIKDTDLDFREGVVWVIGKGRKERDVNLNPETRELIRQWINVRDANPVKLKPAQEGRTFELQRTGIQELMRKISREVGFNVHPHMCRHTFALSYLKAGMDVAQLRRMMGHKSIETTLIYANLNAADVRPVHDTIKPPGLLPGVTQALPNQPSRRLRLVKKAS